MNSPTSCTTDCDITRLEGLTRLLKLVQSDEWQALMGEVADITGTEVLDLEVMKKALQIKPETVNALLKSLRAISTLLGKDRLKRSEKVELDALIEGTSYIRSDVRKVEIDNEISILVSARDRALAWRKAEDLIRESEAFNLATRYLGETDKVTPEVIGAYLRSEERQQVTHGLPEDETVWPTLPETVLREMVVKAFRAGRKDGLVVKLTAHVHARRVELSKQTRSRDWSNWTRTELQEWLDWNYFVSEVIPQKTGPKKAIAVLERLLAPKTGVKKRFKTQVEAKPRIPSYDFKKMDIESLIGLFRTWRNKLNEGDPAVSEKSLEALRMEIKSGRKPEYDLEDLEGDELRDEVNRLEFLVNDLELPLERILDMAKTLYEERFEAPVSILEIEEEKLTPEQMEARRAKATADAERATRREAVSKAGPKQGRRGNGGDKGYNSNRPSMPKAQKRARRRKSAKKRSKK